MFPELFRDDVFRLETRRLRLRWPHAADAAALGHLVVQYDAQMRSGLIPEACLQAAIDAYVLLARAGNAHGRTLDLVIALRGSRELIGQICLWTQNGGFKASCFIDRPLRTDEYASEAMTTLVEKLAACSPSSSLARLEEHVMGPHVDRALRQAHACAEHAFLPYLETGSARARAPWAMFVDASPVSREQTATDATRREQFRARRRDIHHRPPHGEIARYAVASFTASQTEVDSPTLFL